MNAELEGKVVVVTGASGGIGSEIARKFAAEGARLVLHCRNHRKHAEELRQELSPVESIVVRADLTKEAEAKCLFTQAVRRFGRVDTLIANAGSWETRDIPMHEMSLKQWRQTLDAVLTSAFLSLREFLRLAARQKRGNAVLIASTAGVFGEAGHADYAAAKSALAFGLTRSLKNELTRIAPHTAKYCGGRINCVCPGWTVVPRNAAQLSNAKVVRKVTATMALPQIARPSDIANAVVFLASDALARHITGQTLVIAGGMEGRLLWQPGEIDPTLA
jgi:3-oxoacyl-[acyl-carrier protein] reductase